MKKSYLTKLTALFLVALMVFTTVIPANVSAMEASVSTYRSKVYSVDGIPAFAYDGADLSQDGVTFLKLTDNKTLAKALYYSYGALGYSKEYAAIDEVYSEYGAKSETDKLAVSEMVLAKIMEDGKDASDKMAKSFLKAIDALPDCDPAFTPYYIVSGDGEQDILGYTSTSSVDYEMPTEETSEETTTEEETSEASTEDVSTEDVSTEEASTEEISSEDTEEVTTETTEEETTEEEEKNLRNPDGTYKDGIRNRNKGTLSSKLGGVSDESILSEIENHWSDGTYLGRKDYDHYDFVSTLLSNISGKSIDTNVMEFAEKKDLEVYQFSGSVSDITKKVFGLKYSYLSMGDILVVTSGDKEYCGVYTELAFYQKNLDDKNKNCKYNKIPGWEDIDSEFDAQGNDLAWMWYDGETTKLTPMEFDGDIKLSVIKANRDMNITAEGQGYQDLGGGATLYQEADIDMDALNENEDEGLAANDWKDAFTHDKTQMEKAGSLRRYGAYIVNDDDKHATMYYRIDTSEKNYDADHKSCKKYHKNFGTKKNPRYYCPINNSNKSENLITCGEATLSGVTSSSEWKGGNIKIENCGKGSVKGSGIIPSYANTNKDYKRLYETLMVNPDKFKGKSFKMSKCRDKGEKVPAQPGSSKEGYYELYAISASVNSKKELEYQFAIIWYSDKRLLLKETTQRLCSVVTMTVPQVKSTTPKTADGKLSVKKVPAGNGNLSDGTYTFELLKSDQKTSLGTQSVTVSGGVSTTATFKIAKCFNYTNASKASNGAPQYKNASESVYYLREISAPSGMTCDPNKLTEITVENSRSYEWYLQYINETNVAKYNNESTSIQVVELPTPEFSSRSMNYSGNMVFGYADSELKPAVGFTKTAKSTCASIVQGNPNYSLEGAVYGVYLDQKGTQPATWYGTINYQVLSGEQDAISYGNPTPAVFHTNADGSFKEHTIVSGNAGLANTFANRVCMEPGSYWIKEITAPKGYQLNPNPQPFTITAGSYDNAVVVTDDVKIDPFQVSFNKKLTGGNTELSGVSVSEATFKVEYFTDKGLANKKYEASFKVNTEGNVFFTKDTAFNSTFPEECWQGWKNVQQLHLPAGYIRVTENNNDTNESVGTLRKAVVKLNDGTTVDISKGIVFQVKYEDEKNRKEQFICITANNTVVDENTVEQIEDERVKRFDICFKKEDENGEPMAGIPFIIENTKTGEKHLVVSDDNGFVTTKRTDSVTVDGQTKTLDEYKSSKAPYYNGLDAYLDKLTDKDVVKNKLRPAPVWFYGTNEDVSKEASFVAERDTEDYHGSLVYADAKDYVIYEVATEKSNDKQLVAKGDIRFGCTKDGDLIKITDGRLDGVVTNYNRQKIKTLSRDAATQSRYSKQDKNVTVIDNFSVTNLQYGHSYTVKGVLVSRGTTVVGDKTYQAGELIKDCDGKYITAHSAFTTDKTAGDGSSVSDDHASSRKDKTYTSYDTDADGNITAQTSLVYRFNAVDFGSCNAVWYTYLCEGIDGADGADLVITDDGKVDKDASKVIKAGVISEENQYYDYVEDEDLTNTKEFVDMVGIDTDAFTQTFGTANETPGKETEIFDTVSVSGLADGAEYQLVSKLADPKTGEILKDADGNEIIGLINGETDKFTYTKGDSDSWKGVVKYPKIDTTAYAGKSIVCFQYLYDADGILVGDDTKLTNDRETIHFPSIKTTASGHEGEKLVSQYGEIEINDEVKYSSLSLNKEYTITGTLHYKDADGNEAVLHHKDGSKITASATFTPTKPEEVNGSVTVTFKFDVSDVLEDVYSWQETVVFEDLYHDGKLLVSHADIEDKDQKVLYPGIHTSLREKDTGVQHVKSFDKELELIDTVSYTNLKIGKTYRVIGKLVNAETGEVLKNGGKEIIGTTTFTPTKDGDVFTGGKTSEEGPAGNAAGENPDGQEDSAALENDPFKDYVSGSVEVKFTFNGKEAGLVSEDGHNAPIVAYEYVYDEFDMEKATLEKTNEDHAGIYTGVTLWTSHTDISDVEQTVTAPTGQTTFTDNVTKAHVVSTDSVITLTDKITYRGLIKGKTYVATGTLYIPKEQANEVERLLAEKDENGNECCPLLDESGNKIQGPVTFVAETPDGEVEVSFTLNRSLIEKTKKQIVAFEDVSTESEGSVFTHKSIQDKNQTVYVPEVHTTALSEDTKDHFAGSYPKAKIVDTVQVSNLEPNRQYKLVGTLMNQKTGDAFTSNDQPITSEAEFESKTDKDSFNGTVDVVFEFDASLLLAGQTTVVFEKLYMKNDEGKWMECGGHEDIKDEGQSVHYSDIHTTALGKSTKKHNVPCESKTKIVDSVYYSNLIPGKQYKITGLVMAIPKGMKATDLDTVKVEDGKTLADYTMKYYPDKNLYIDINGYKCKPLLENGEKVTSEITFTPTESSGVVDIVFTVDTSKLAGRTLVVFEDVYNDKNVLVGSHADITDKGQTVTVKTPKTPGDDTPSIDTGDNFPFTLVIVLAFVFLAGIIGLLIAKKKFLK